MRDSSKKELAAEAMKITAKDLTEFGIIDDVIPEPSGGAHTDHDAAAALVDQSLQKHLGELKQLSPDELVKARYDKFRTMAQYFTEVSGCSGRLRATRVVCLPSSPFLASLTALDSTASHSTRIIKLLLWGNYLIFAVEHLCS